jgi:hypothetical protein
MTAKNEELCEIITDAMIYRMEDDGKILVEVDGELEDATKYIKQEYIDHIQQEISMHLLDDDFGSGKDFDLVMPMVCEAMRDYVGDDEIKEIVYSGEYAAGIIDEMEPIGEYYSVRFWVNGEEVNGKDIKIVFYVPTDGEKHNEM